MRTCQYHPLQAATFSCASCAIDTCDQCSDESPGYQQVNCFVCAGNLAPIATNNQAEPFWRRFEQAFRYAAAPQALTLILGLSLLTSIAAYLPFSIVWYLAAFAVLMKYSFNCLQHTAEGQMEAPDIAPAFTGGFSLLLRLLLIFIAVAASISLVYSIAGPVIAGIVGIIAIAALPASIIIFAMTDRLGRAVNPLQALQLMGTIGLPYGLLLGVLVVMSGSVQVISQLFGELALLLNSGVSNYYTIVSFHIMGYMLFQYQAELGYESEASATPPPSRELESWALAKARVLVQAGRYDQADKHLRQALKKLPGNNTLHSRYLEFLLATHSPLRPKTSDRLRAFACRYLKFLLRKNLDYKLSAAYLRIRKTLPDYQPDCAELRFALARACRSAGQPNEALTLLNGLHKTFPDYKELIPAYQLMADTLEETPGMASQAQKCRVLLKKLVQRKRLSA